MFERLNFLVEGYPFPLWEALLRIVIALLCGALIGLERERRRQPAGFRTHSVLAIGSSLLSIVSIYIPSVYGSGLNVDPSRIASQVVSGIGFLGAGAILRMGLSVKGLTTAASLWTTAGIGLALGAGMYTLSIFSTFTLLVVLSLMSKFEREFISKKRKTIKILLESPSYADSLLNDLLPEGKLVKISKKAEGTELHVETLHDEESNNSILKELIRREGVISAEFI